ncbi:twin-arginine translocase TatA/TatE family subunit [Flavobacterium sp. MAH-1]|uniref:Sec-independent protein translocase protein TatA n=1 Tax=Flavobacterium agri TaxID=2743471 RepID=A0A7Y8Y3J0_9FLAO|nr:twin-arginine translocase TatA/TatE family subunit [Flavobacterium agri]NUY81698.1 twin-arginine translocase TatA/TatE family subunit [Flavobacterium agri]NYA71722.1 twin-arginine translocase TatA/TatE family subunit [Flavobacterium agri]
MFGIGGGELIFIIFVVLMLFGSDKIPEMARALGKGMRQLKDATNEIKSEINKGAEANGLDKSLFDIKSNINSEIDKAKESLMSNSADLEKTKQEIDEIASGPIKRQGR